MDESDRQELQEQLAHLSSLADKAYGDMYETGIASSATGYYAEARECLTEAIRVACELGLSEQVRVLRERLSQIETVYRAQFGG